jgi:DNA repair exonuclease SbcCD ATPase subunit
MNKRQSKRVALVAVVAVSAVLLNLTLAIGQQSPGGSTPAPVPDKQAILQQVQIESVPNALKAIAAAKEAIQAGHAEHALAELQKAEQALKVIQTSLAQYTGPRFANTTCPIMGSPIDPDKVPENLTRTYQGQKVAFCCGGCPGAWDKLTDAQQDAKLNQASAQPAKVKQAAPAKARQAASGCTMGHMGH